MEKKYVWKAKASFSYHSFQCGECDAHIIQRGPTPSHLHLASRVNQFRNGGEYASPKGQIGRNPHTHK